MDDDQTSEIRSMTARNRKMLKLWQKYRSKTMGKSNLSELRRIRDDILIWGNAWVRVTVEQGVRVVPLPLDLLGRTPNPIRMGEHAPDCECLKVDEVKCVPDGSTIFGRNIRTGTKYAGDPLDCWSRWMAKPD